MTWITTAKTNIPTSDQALKLRGKLNPHPYMAQVTRPYSICINLRSIHMYTHLILKQTHTTYTLTLTGSIPICINRNKTK